MSKAVRLRSSIEYKTMLLEGNPQFENFYKEELIDFCKIAKKIILDQEKENQQLKEQLQQRDEVIEEAIEFINNARYDKELKTIAYGGLNVNGINGVLDILNQYKKEESK